MTSDTSLPCTHVFMYNNILHLNHDASYLLFFIPPLELKGEDGHSVEQCQFCFCNGLQFVQFTIIVSSCLMDLARCSQCK